MYTVARMHVLIHLQLSPSTASTARQRTRFNVSVLYETRKIKMEVPTVIFHRVRPYVTLTLGQRFLCLPHASTRKAPTEFRVPIYYCPPEMSSSCTERRSRLRYLYDRMLTLLGTRTGT